MDENILETRIKQRCDTESNWNASNPILLENEVGYIPDGRYKIGDGSSTWSSLPYNTADTANIATKSIQDSAGQQINITYIKGLSVSGTTVTYTKGDGSTGTIKTQDTNTTYSTGTASISGLTKLYTGTGTATDGTMTQNAINTELGNKSVVKIVRWS